MEQKSECELVKKLNAIEAAVNMLNDVSRTILQMKYFKRYEMEVIAESVFISRRAAYYRVQTALKEISYIIANINI